MKKNYIKPSQKFRTVHVTHILMASPESAPNRIKLSEQDEEEDGRYVKGASFDDNEW